MTWKIPQIQVQLPPPPPLSFNEDVAFGTEPGWQSVSEHAVQDHQALDGAVDRDSPAVPVVRLADGRIERLVMNVKDARPSG